METFVQEEKKENGRLLVILVLVWAILLLALIVGTVNAQTITMANPDGTAERDIIVYWPNGTLYGSYNTSSIITTDGNDSYIFTLKPQGNNFIDDPSDWLTNYAFPWVKTNAIAIILIAVLIGIAFYRRT